MEIFYLKFISVVLLEINLRAMLKQCLNHLLVPVLNCKFKNVFVCLLVAHKQSHI